MISAIYPAAAWERPLIDQAREAQLGGFGAIQRKTTDQVALERAYRHCSRLTAQHSRSFYLASALLPPEKRSAMRALYAFCRVTDDIVDNPEIKNRSISEAELSMSTWRRESLGVTPASDNPVVLAWTDARQRYRIPLRYAEQLLDGVTCDLRQTRYQTFADLAGYAYGVASTVGLMSMHITGFSGPMAIPYAIKLGVALQITNILRDVGEDWRSGRVYLPADELAEFGLDEDDLAIGQVDDRWRKFMRFQIQRNRRLYAEAWPGISMLHPDGRLAIAAAADFYAAILDDIEAHGYNVFTRRAHISAWDKFRRLPGIWWRAKAHPKGIRLA